MGRIPILVLAVLCWTTAAFAQPVSPAADLDWQSVPLFGADVRSLALHPEEPETLWAGTSSGQIYRSPDGGDSWRELGVATPLGGWVVGDLVVETSDRLWAALWGVWGGGSVVLSDDGGHTWRSRSEGLPGEQIYTLARAAGRLYAGTRSGVYGSRDDGASWQPLTGQVPEIQKVTSLWIDPADPERVIAGTWRRAYRSLDGGRSWQGVFEGMALDSEVFRLVPVPEQPGTLWASTCGWVYRSRNGGTSWTRFREGLAWRRTPSFAALAGGDLLAGTVGGLYRSRDGGESWQRRTSAQLAVLDIAHRGERVWLATEGSGVWRSDDGGASFERSARGMTNVRIAALAVSGEQVLAAVNHAGPASGIYSSKDGFQRPQRGLPSVLDLAVAGPRLLAATEDGLYERIGADWRVVREVGEGRFEELATVGERAVVRSRNGLFESAGGVFRPLPEALAEGQGLALTPSGLWLSAGARLLRWSNGEVTSVAAPASSGRVAAGGSLLYASEDGLWHRATGDEPWRRLLDQPARALATGHRRYGSLILGEKSARLWDRTAARLIEVTLPVAASRVSAVRTVGDRLYLGTIDRGLWSSDLPAASSP
ncbi:MAG: hypothetical protein AAF604_14440 [Acidobacteriota bacterium]